MRRQMSSAQICDEAILKILFSEAYLLPFQKLKRAANLPGKKGCFPTIFKEARRLLEATYSERVFIRAINKKELLSSVDSDTDGRTSIEIVLLSSDFIHLLCENVVPNFCL